MNKKPNKRAEVFAEKMMLIIYGHLEMQTKHWLAIKVMEQVTANHMLKQKTKATCIKCSRIIKRKVSP